MHVDARTFDAISDAVDEGLYGVRHAFCHYVFSSDNSVAVNKIKGTTKPDDSEWAGQSRFDAEKDKTQFRQYEEACERVRNFYREQHGGCPFPGSSLAILNPPPRLQRSRRSNTTSRFVRSSRRLSAHEWVCPRLAHQLRSD